MKLITAEQMQAIDRNAIENLGIPGALLMENAGRAAAEEILNDAYELFPGPIMVLAGPGNNGGDGYVVARILADRGWQVETIILAAEERISGDAALMLQILKQLNGNICFIEDQKSLCEAIDNTAPQLFIDALLGTGLSTEVAGIYRQAIELVNQHAAQVVAVDIPSGVSGSDGRVLGAAIEADLTLSFDSAKVGHYSRPGADYVGELRVLEIGIPRSGRPQSDYPYTLIDEAVAASFLPVRSSSGHKGSFGHLGIVAGSTGMSGAAALCSEAGLRSGAGLVTLACPAGIHDIMETKLTEVMTRPLAGQSSHLCTDSVSDILSISGRLQAMVLGPGLGQDPAAVAAVRQLVAACHCPLVVDADALNALAGTKDLFWPSTDRLPVLTPHPGEFSRLTGLTIAEIEADRFRLARQFAIDQNVVLLLKGAKTLIADPAGRVRINSSGNAGLATAGSGDILSGLVGGLLAQGLSSFDAASLGAWLHGAAADFLMDEIGCAGMLAGDLLKTIPVVRYQLEGALYADC